MLSIHSLPGLRSLSPKQGYSEIDDRKLPLDTDEVISVTMVASGVIIGKVVDARTGNPIRAFNVRITFSPKRRVGEPATTLITRLIDPGQSYQSAEGRFTLGDLVHGMPLQVMVSAEGYERRVAERVVASRPDDAKVEEFRLDPIDPGGLRTYHGRLRDEHGNPVAGAQVRLIAARDRDPDRRREFPFNWTMIQNGQLSQQSNVSRFLESSTDAQGRYEFTRVPAKDEVELAWWGKSVPHGRTDHLERVDPQASFDIAIPAPARILVILDGKTLAGGGRLQVNQSGDFSDQDDQELKPGQKEYEFPTLAAGEYTVYLMSPYEREPGTSDGLTSRTLAHVTVSVASGETRTCRSEAIRGDERRRARITLYRHKHSITYQETGRSRAGLRHSPQPVEPGGFGPPTTCRADRDPGSQNGGPRDLFEWRRSRTGILCAWREKAPCESQPASSRTWTV